MEVMVWMIMIHLWQLLELQKHHLKNKIKKYILFLLLGDNFSFREMWNLSRFFLKIFCHLSFIRVIATKTTEHRHARSLHNNALLKKRKPEFVHLAVFCYVFYFIFSSSVFFHFCVF